MNLTGMTCCMRVQTSRSSKVYFHLLPYLHSASPYVPFQKADGMGYGWYWMKNRSDEPMRYAGTCYHWPWSEKSVQKGKKEQEKQLCRTSNLYPGTNENDYKSLNSCFL